MFSSVSNLMQRASAKHFIIAAGFVAAMATAVGLGVATKQFTSAADIKRDCDNNAILRCGAATPSEFISDVKSLNTNTQTKQADLQNIYAHFGLSPEEYARFQSSAKMGTVDNKGNVKVNGQTVMTGAWSMGRQSFGNPSRQPYKIGSTTYYASPTSVSFASGVTSLPVMVMFAKDGTVETAIMNACGNPVWGTKPTYACKALNATKVSDDEYSFTTTAPVTGGAKVSKVVYDFGDGTKKEVSSPSTPVSHKYATAGTFKAKVTVYFNLPGYGDVAVAAVDCVKEVKVIKPYYTCKALDAVALNNEKTKFRFTVRASYGNGATLKSADFTLDGNNTTTGVVPDSKGVISKDYAFAQDGKSHTVLAKVNFNVAGKVTSVTCQAKVTSGKTPECKPGIPVGSPECEEKQECKPGVPMGSPECEEYKCPIEGKEDLPKEECVETPEELPHTGMGGVAGLFAGTSALGAVAHRVISSRRNRQ